MSAFIVCDEHISAMLQAATGQYPGDGACYYWENEPHYFGGSVREIGQKLLDQNYRSVNYLYQEDAPTPAFRLCVVKDRIPAEIIAACDCYTYQACETPDWPKTEAYAIVEVLKQRAIRQLPGYGFREIRE